MSKIKATETNDWKKFLNERKRKNPFVNKPNPFLGVDKNPFKFLPKIPSAPLTSEFRPVINYLDV